ncbi:sigma-70 family RNA polymerase sigma factor [Actinophytocola sediminis]
MTGGVDFEEHRARLHAVAYRMLGSPTEADDAVQETWLRLNHADTAEVVNPAAWLTTVVARVCLNMLRARETRREEPLGTDVPESAVDPARAAELADSVGLAMLVVLDTLTPAERLAFVLHDMFAVPFDEIAPMIAKTPAATRQLASRARRRVRGTTRVPDADLARQRPVVEAYLAAARDGDFDALLTLLAPDVVLRADPAVVPSPKPITLRGVRAVGKTAVRSGERAAVSVVALVDGSYGIVMAPHGRLAAVLAFTFTGDRISEIDMIADPDRLRALELGVR